VGEEILRYQYRYPNRPPILLVFFRVTSYRGELRNRQFARVLWETPERLSDYDFVDGDHPFLSRLAAGEL
jgi:hypothetical protein